MFDKTLLFEMSYALMRPLPSSRFRSPQESVFGELIEREASREQAVGVAKALLEAEASRILDLSCSSILRGCRRTSRCGGVGDGRARVRVPYAFPCLSSRESTMRLAAICSNAMSSLIGVELQDSFETRWSGARTRRTARQAEPKDETAAEDADDEES